MGHPELARDRLRHRHGKGTERVREMQKNREKNRYIEKKQIQREKKQIQREKNRCREKKAERNTD
jgi:hypothetical protein